MGKSFCVFCEKCGLFYLPVFTENFAMNTPYNYDDSDSVKKFLEIMQWNKLPKEEGNEGLVITGPSGSPRILMKF
jgi:hypothetical protein